MNFRLVAVAVGALVVGSVTPSVAQAPSGVRVQHTANLGNIINNFTKLDNAAWNGNANAVLLVQPIGVQKQVGVFYDGTSSRWAIFNEDKSGMTNGVKFNVVSDGGFVHRATAANITSGWTRLDNPATNGQSGAVVFVTQRWNAAGANGGYNDRAVGAWYDPTAQRWAIYNEDRSPMGAGLEFNVKVFATNNSVGSPAVNVWRTGPGNTGSPTTLSPPRLSGGGIFFLTHNFNPSNVGSIYFNSAWGVASTTNGAWQVVAAGSIPNDLAFNVLTY